MSNDPARPGDLPTAAQVQELIDLLTRVLHQARNTEMADTIQEFVVNLEAILTVMGRLADRLDLVTPAGPAIEALDSRMDRLEIQMGNISTILTELHGAMLAPIDPD